jgi:kynurenine formamidase
MTAADSSVGAYDGDGSESPQWWPSRYGADDQRGAANELNDQAVLVALGLPRHGKLLDLAQVLDSTSPLGTPPRSFNMLVLAHGSLSDTELASKQNELTYFEEHAEHTYHVGTHLDGLGHVGIAGRFYNGHTYGDIYSPMGLSKLGAENIPPIITRGVILDIAGLVGDEVLPTGFQISVELLEDAVRRQEVELRPGDAVLLHTGWANLWQSDPDAYAAGEPGVVVEAAKWLIERRPCVVGADNWAFEVVPAVDPERPFIAHQHLITESGIYIIENITTKALRDAGASEFLFVMTPLSIRGATGSMVRPAAVI